MYHENKRVLLLMHPWAGYLEKIQQGIAEYLTQRPEWVCTRLQPQGSAPLRVTPDEYDGVIAYVEKEYVGQLAEWKIPVVDISSWLTEPAFPQVITDHRAVGQMAAKYLLSLGLRHFGALGPLGQRPRFSETRRDSFIETLAAEGLSVDTPESQVHTLAAGTAVPRGLPVTLAAWLMQLPRPVGVFGTYDSVAAEVLEACRHLGIRVPEEICVLGVDNNELIGRFSHPPLSSIALPLSKLGFEAARLLDRLMAGEAAPKEPICLPPIGVVARQSTNLLAIGDPDVQAAVRYIREHVRQGIAVTDLLEVVSVNRRYLELKFQKYLGRTPAQEIRRVRLERAKQLLAETDLSIAAIAAHSGYANAERMANVFRTQLGLSPKEYRKPFLLQAI